MARSQQTPSLLGNRDELKEGEAEGEEQWSCQAAGPAAAQDRPSRREAAPADWAPASSLRSQPGDLRSFEHREIIPQQTWPWLHQHSQN